MFLIPIDPIPPNSNPFHYDMSRMGIDVNKNVIIMTNGHSNEKVSNIIIVNTETGMRSILYFNNPFCHICGADLQKISKIRDIKTDDGFKLVCSQACFLELEKSLK